MGIMDPVGINGYIPVSISQFNPGKSCYSSTICSMYVIIGNYCTIVVSKFDTICIEIANGVIGDCVCFSQRCCCCSVDDDSLVGAYNRVIA